MYVHLVVSSYNCNGCGTDRMNYIGQLLKHSDILFIQENWLLDSTLAKLQRSLPGTYVHGVSGMDETQLRCGRPFDGVAIL